MSKAAQESAGSATTRSPHVVSFPGFGEQGCWHPASSRLLSCVVCQWIHASSLGSWAAGVPTTPCSGRKQMFSQLKLLLLSCSHWAGTRASLLMEPLQDGFSLPGVWAGLQSREMQNSEGGSQAQWGVALNWFFVSVRFPGPSSAGTRCWSYGLMPGAWADQVF